MRPVSKIAVASLLTLSILTSFATAQAKKSGGVVENLKEALAKLTTPLSEEQKTKTDAALAEAEKELAQLSADAKAAGKNRTDAEKKEAGAKRQAVAKKLRADIDAILTAPQKKELKAAQAEQKKAVKDAKEPKPADDGAMN
ncbi:hypothetical protein EON77_07055 [bacterium]|nr:MAG: hypothetical protein EON77_07055 [bacterium]